MPVPLVSHGHKHRQRKAGDTDRQVVIVKAHQIRHRPASAQQQHRIVLRPLGQVVQHTVQGIYNAGRSRRSLHRSRIQPCVKAETVAVVVKMIHEVPVTGGRLGSYQGKPPGQPRHRQRLVHLQQSLPGQPLQSPLPGQFHLPEGEGRIYVLDAQAHAVQFGILHPHPYQHRHTGLQPAPGSLIESRLHQRASRPPDDRRHLRAEHIPPGAFLHQLHITVSVAVNPQLVYLRLHPDRSGERLRHRAFYPLQQLRQ